MRLTMKDTWMHAHAFCLRPGLVDEIFVCIFFSLAFHRVWIINTPEIDICIYGMGRLGNPREDGNFC